MLKKPSRPHLEALESRLVPKTGDLVAVAALPGTSAVVRLCDPTTGVDHLRLTAYDAYEGAVNVACGDIDGDGLVDLVTGSTAGTAAHVKAFSGRDGSLLHSFFVFEPAYLGGINVAAADMNDDGVADIVVGSQTGASHVQVFRGSDLKLIHNFLAFDPLFFGGVSIACGDVNGDARADLIVGASTGGGPHVKVLDGNTLAEIRSFFAFDPLFIGGVRVAVGDTNGDGYGDILVGSGPGTRAHLKTFSGIDNRELASFFAFDASYTGGVSPGGCAIDDNQLDIMATSSAGGPATRVFSGETLTELTAIIGSPGSACTGASVADTDAVLDWNRAARAAIRANSTPPPRASRALAILHAAIYDAVNNIVGGHEAYKVTMAAPENASPEAAAASAGHAVLVALFPAQKAKFHATREALLSLIPDGTGKTDGITYGADVAQEILALRFNDGSSTVVPFTPGTDPGDWRPTPPGFAAALLPNWPNVTPFVMTTGAQFRPQGPPALASAEYATELNEVKKLGRATDSTRTADQTQIARFWADGAGTVTPPGHWNQIADKVSGLRNLSLAENARLFAQLNLAEADAAIIAWDAKYHFVDGKGLWRPVTAIVNAADDNNPATETDPDWQPLLTTPPFPEYVSGHSTFSGAAERVLTLFFGPIAFSIHTDALPGVVRHFASFAQAAAEAGRSRIFGGIHFASANEDGLAAGQALGNLVAGTVLI